ncbi:MAG: phytanoyl-CoA dioxygenase family protein [Chloroflexota bacterium]
MNINITKAERTADQMSPDKAQQAVSAILTDGFVVLDNAVSHGSLDRLREKMIEDSQRLIEAEKWGGAGRLPGHLQQGPPPMAPFVFRDIVSNPFVIQVTKGVLGEGLFNSFYNGNCNCPGSGTQPLHADHPHLWPNMEKAHPPASLVVNICLTKVTEENGAVELWPGSHHNTKPVSDENVAAQREITPPIPGETEKGSVLIRDMRVWHRGVPNHSNEIRHMIAMVHNISWRVRNQTLRYGLGCEEAFDSTELDHNAVFMDEPIDYLFGEFIRP